jgi:serine/threonine protein kinase
VYLHRLSILHGGIAPVGKAEKQMTSHADTRYVKGNILVTRDSQACLGDFGITGGYRDLAHYEHKLETLRYMAPERFLPKGYRGDPLPTLGSPSRESDVYSLMTSSFKVFSPAVNRPTT